MFGYTKEQLLKLTVTDLSLGEPPYTQEEALRLVRKTAEEGPQLVEWIVKHKNGQLFWAEVNLRVAVIEGENRVLAILRDITERKEAEQATYNLYKELEAKNKELESILYAVSHDLKSPLVNIQGFGYELSQSYDLIRSALTSKGKVGDMEKGVDIALNENIPNALDFILASSIKMDSLLSGLLDYCRLGTAAMNVRTIDMNTMMTDVSENMEYQIKEAKAEVDIEPLLPCLGDPSQINRVFTNLVTNALKFLDESRPGQIRIYGRSQDDQSIYCVEDNGIGIAPEHQEEIFEIF
ncbi:MAG: sensor histidine kinase, partial [Planctomycetota bacterium]